MRPNRPTISISRRMVMATTLAPNRPRRRSQPPAPQSRASVPVREASDGHESEYDLLTAALIGVTIGAGITFMLRRGPSGRSPMSPVVRGLGRGATWAGRNAGRLGVAGARWTAKRGEEAWDRIPRDEIREHVSDYVGTARDAIDEFVETELKDLRRAIRRQRKRLGV
jgi:hypothetical protein